MGRKTCGTHIFSVFVHFTTDTHEAQLIHTQAHRYTHATKIHVLSLSPPPGYPVHVRERMLT